MFYKFALLLGFLLIRITSIAAVNCGQYSSEPKTALVSIIQCPEDLSEIKFETLFTP